MFAGSSDMSTDTDIDIYLYPRTYESLGESGRMWREGFKASPLSCRYLELPLMTASLLTESFGVSNFSHTIKTGETRLSTAERNRIAIRKPIPND